MLTWGVEDKGVTKRGGNMGCVEGEGLTWEGEDEGLPWGGGDVGIT